MAAEPRDEAAGVGAPRSLGLPRVRVSEAMRQAWRALWLSRLLVWTAGVGGFLAWGNSARAPGFDPAGLTTPFGGVGDALVAPAARWDATWYLSIARDGYDNGPKDAFFPLYPMLLRPVGIVLGSPVLGAIVLSTACFFVALVAVHELTALELGPEAARWTVLVLAFSPMAFFASAVYSESLFLALSVGAVLAARRDRWAWAGVLGGLSAATRSAGIVVLVALALLAIAQHARVRDMAWLMLVPAGLGAFLGGLALIGLDAGAPFEAQDVWFRSFAGPFGGVWDGAVAAWDGGRQLLAGQSDRIYFTKAGGDPMAIARQNLVLFAWVPLTAAALVGVARRLPLAYAAYVLAALALPLSYPVGPQPLMSLPRFAFVLFPLWMWLGDVLARHPRVRVPALVAGAAGLVAATAQFATWHFVA